MKVLKLLMPLCRVAIVGMKKRRMDQFLVKPMVYVKCLIQNLFSM